MKNEKIEALLSRMTLEEKLSQLTQEYVTNDRIESLKELAKRGEFGSCILAADGLAGSSRQEEIFLSELNRLQKYMVEESRLGIPFICGRDVIHGSRTIFPIPLAQAATWDYDLIRDAAAIMSEEASYDGVHWTFAPMLDICADPRWGRIIETPGEDPLLGRLFARASVDGIQGEDMAQPGKLAACAKHYIGYGASQGGRDKDPTEWSDYSLRNRALPAFREAVDAGAATVMSAFNEISGQPATSSRYHLTDILRGELGFQGFVVSDWEAIKRLTVQGVSDSDEMSATLAINAGVDMDMAHRLYKDHLKNALEKGNVTMDTIDGAVRRVLRVKFQLGLFEHPYTEPGPGRVLCGEFLEKAREISAHAMVLLKNDRALPLAKGKKVIVGGPYATDRENLLGSWFAGGRGEDTVTLAEGIARVNGEENTILKDRDADSKYRVMAQADTIILALGEDRAITGEGCTITDIEMEEAQVALAKQAKGLGKKVIAVIFAGRPLALTELRDHCDAILWAWHGGTMCGLAAADILFGDFDPCGRLPVTFPRSTGQIPIHYNHNPNEFITSGYDAPHLYAAKTSDSRPLYPFGYGLSYTEFTYSGFDYGLEKDAFRISFDIENTGAFDGFETAQCYIRDLVASMARPVKELKAFEKVFLKAGERKRITFRLEKEDLSFYDGRGRFVFEPGRFQIWIGKSSSHICFETTADITF